MFTEFHSFQKLRSTKFTMIEGLAVGDTKLGRISQLAEIHN